ncbi:TetR/AcrR family transcriptional regulator [Streptomyces hundungensis]|uniref:TetR/AcrR family transcriptional regulator n=1 Tax=Streptomyces hundungensis TaxID=1077946 RepID=UPI0033FA799C
MAEPEAGTPRERYRAQVRAEIKQHAWEQIGTAGASALSLNAIAKQMGLSGPALYRYFAGRDELITALVREAYRSLADTLGAAAETSGADLAALAHALRGWALEDPNRYFLVYGTPVPGYHAPDKQALFAAVYQQASDRLLDGTPIDPTRSLLAQLSAGLDVHFDYFAANRNTVLAANRVLAGDPVIQGIITDELAELSRRVLDATGLRGPARDTVRAALGAWLVFVRALCVDWLTNETFSRTELREMSLGALRGTLRAVAGAERLLGADD